MVKEKSGWGKKKELQDFERGQISPWNAVFLPREAILSLRRPIQSPVHRSGFRGEFHPHAPTRGILVVGDDRKKNPTVLPDRLHRHDARHGSDYGRHDSKAAAPRVPISAVVTFMTNCWRDPAMPSVLPRIWGLLAAALLMASTSAALAVDLSGCWEGTWVSNQSGHKGKLRATITRIDANHYNASFTGTFFKVLPFRYSVVMTVVEDTGDVVHLKGQKDLGKLAGGCYYYTSRATCCCFHTDYCSKKDHGTFDMQRVPCCK
jgi:hypothetical protein